MDAQSLIVSNHGASGRTEFSEGHGQRFEKGADGDGTRNGLVGVGDGEERHMERRIEPRDGVVRWGTGDGFGGEPLGAATTVWLRRSAVAVESTAPTTASPGHPKRRERRGGGRQMPGCPEGEGGGSGKKKHLNQLLQQKKNRKRGRKLMKIKRLEAKAPSTHLAQQHHDPAFSVDDSAVPLAATRLKAMKIFSINCKSFLNFS